MNIGLDNQQCQCFCLTRQGDGFHPRGTAPSSLVRGRELFHPKTLKLDRGNMYLKRMDFRQESSRQYQRHRICSSRQKGSNNIIASCWLVPLGAYQSFNVI